MSILALIAVGAGAVLAFGLLVVSGYRKVGPNEVLIVSGRNSELVDPSTGEVRKTRFRIVHGGGTFVVPLRERVDVMSVELMTLEIRTPEFFTKFGVPIVVDGIAQIKVRSDDVSAIAMAAEMFLSKSKHEMNDIAHQMMQGHLRAVISTLPFEEIHANPEAFAQTVQRLTAADLANMGIQVVSFTIREIQDPNGYLQAVGRPQLAEVQKNAEIGEARATRDATMGRATAEREAKVCAAEAQRAARLAEIASEVAVANAQSDRDCQLHELSAKVSHARASGDLAYDVAAAQEQRSLMEQRLALEALKIRSKENQLLEEIDKPAEAERRRIEIMAAADAARRGLAAKAEAEAIRARGVAEADSCERMALAEAAGLRAKLEAEAEGMQRKADAWQRYSSAALGQLLIERLPEIATAVASPLANVEKIVLVGSGGESSAGLERVTASVTNVMAQLPAVVEGLSGIDLGALLTSLGDAQTSRGPAPSTVLGPEVSLDEADLVELASE